MKKRIEWIDIAKAIAVMLMAAGHTYEYGSLIRNIIFSFHMPLFFVLSGYTFHYCSSWSEVWQKTKKDFKRLILPVLGVVAVEIAVDLYHGEAGVLHKYALALVWSSGISVRGQPDLGKMWFLVSLFWGRLILRTAGMLFPKEYRSMMAAMLGIPAVLIGNSHPLIQNFDVTLAAVMFMAIGLAAHHYQAVIRRYKIQIFIISMVFWLFCLQHGLYIEMAVRSYPEGIICVMEAVCGTYLCCIFSRALVSLKAGRILQQIGQHTLLFLCIHSLDYIWASAYTLTSSHLVMSLLRTGEDLIVLYVLLYMQKFIETHRSQTDRHIG